MVFKMLRVVVALAAVVFVAQAALPVNHLPQLVSSASNGQGEARLMSLAAKKAAATKSKGPFNHANAWKAYDHNLDPQSFPK